MFGFPINFNLQDARLVPGADNVEFENYSRKYSKAMFGIIADGSYKKEDEPYYDFYKAIGRKSEKSKFSDVNLRYDSTVILNGDANGEYKKTAGHFHYEITGESISYPELYQVIKGKALFVMQKVADFRKDGRMLVKDAVIAEVNAGEAIVIPPDYGHCSINIGGEDMVFINLVSCDSHNYYDSVKKSNGMCCYAMKTPDGGYSIQKNARYDFDCNPRVVVPADSAALGIRKDVPIYTAFLENPGKFVYLNAPEKFEKDFPAQFRDKA